MTKPVPQYCAGNRSRFTALAMPGSSKKAGRSCVVEGESARRCDLEAARLHATPMPGTSRVEDVLEPIGAGCGSATPARALSCCSTPTARATRRGPCAALRGNPSTDGTARGTPRFGRLGAARLVIRGSKRARLRDVVRTKSSCARAPDDICRNCRGTTTSRLPLRGKRRTRIRALPVPLLWEASGENLDDVSAGLGSGCLDAGLARLLPGRLRRRSSTGPPFLAFMGRRRAGARAGQLSRQHSPAPTTRARGSVCQLGVPRVHGPGLTITLLCRQEKKKQKKQKNPLELWAPGLERHGPSKGAAPGSGGLSSRLNLDAGDRQRPRSSRLALSPQTRKGGGDVSAPPTTGCRGSSTDSGATGKITAARGYRLSFGGRGRAGGKTCSGGRLNRTQSRTDETRAVRPHGPTRRTASFETAAATTALSPVLSFGWSWRKGRRVRQVGLRLDGSCRST